MSQNQVFLQKGLLSFLLIWAGKQDLLSDNENTHKKAGCPLVQASGASVLEVGSGDPSGLCHFWFSRLSSPPHVKQGLSRTHLCTGTACHSGWCTIIRTTSIQQFNFNPSWALGRLLQEDTVVLNLLNIPILHMERI